MPTKFMTFTGVASWADESDAHPEHPIVIPPPDYHPEHPIVIPPVPPVDSSGGVPTHPIFLPPVPTHPIVLPPDSGEKPPVDTGAHPEHPIYIPPGIWGGANEPFPTPPIYFPDPAPPAGSGLSEWTWVWLPAYGRWALLPPEGAAQPKGAKKK